MIFSASDFERFTDTVRTTLGPRLGRLRHHRPSPLRRLPPFEPDVVALEALPSIAIVTPSYQQGRFLEATIESVLDQNYPHLDYRVQDGGSTDESVEVLRSFGSRLPHWRSGPDKGQAHAINLGFEGVDADIMAYLNSDDVLLPGALCFVGDYFRRHPEVDVLYGDRLLIDEDGQEIGNWRLPSHSDRILSWADYVPQETLFWRRRVWGRIGGKVDESFQFALDWDMILRLRDAGARFVHVPRFLGAFRVHTLQKTSANIANVGRKEMQTLRRRSLGYEPSVWQIRLNIAPYLVAHMFTDLHVRAWEGWCRGLRQWLGPDREPA